MYSYNSCDCWIIELCNITLFLIGSVFCYKYLTRDPRTLNTVKPCHGATNGERNFVSFSSTLQLAPGKVPGQRAESVSREDFSFLCRSFWQRSNSRASRDEGNVLSKQSYARSSRWRDGNSMGLTLLCSTFLHL